MKCDIWKDCEKVQLTKLLSFIVDNRGKTVPTSDKGHILIATNCIRNENLYPTYEKVRYLNDDTYNNWFRAHPLGGDVIFVNKGTPGRVCLVPEIVDFCIAQDMMAFRVDENIIYNKYLLAVLRSWNIQEQIRITSVGDVIPHFKKSHLDELLIPVPPMNVQKIVGDYYFNLSDKIELNNKINDNLELQAQAIFDDMFGDTQNNENCIGSMLLPKRGKGLLSKDAICGGVPVVAGGLEPSTYHNVSNTNAPVVTISASGANAGFVRLWDIPVWSSDSSFIDNSVSEDVYFWYVLLKKRQKEIYEAQTGSAQPHIYPKHIGEMPFSNISNDDISSFNTLVSPLFKQIGLNDKSNYALSQLRDTLLPKLMSGEIDVSKVEI